MTTTGLSSAYELAPAKCGQRLTEQASLKSGKILESVAIQLVFFSDNASVIKETILVVIFTYFLNTKQKGPNFCLAVAT